MNTHTPKTIVNYESEAADATWAARWEWQRLHARTEADRVSLVADLVWQRGYALAYLHAYADVTEKVAAAATRASADNPEARTTLRQLAAAAIDAARIVTARPVLAPPADEATVAAGRIAAALAGSPQPWQPIAHIAWATSVRIGMLAGALTAATDTLIGWRVRGGAGRTDAVSIDGQAARDWVHSLLITINRGVAAEAQPAPSPPRLARQDQAPELAAVANGTVPTRSTGSAPDRLVVAASPGRRR